jgi:competence protein ComEA
LNSLKPLSASEKKHRKGVFLLFLVIVIIQSIYWKTTKSQQRELASIVDFKTDSTIRSKMDQKRNRLLIQPFNANFLNDYRAYVLGISSDQLHRLEIFRAAGQYLYSLEDFQSVSGVDDSLLLLVKPYLKFPQEKNYFERETKNLEFKNINRATAEDLKKIHGIGAVYSKRIIAYRNSLNGFKSMDQLYKVYGLDSLLIKKIMLRFNLE